MLMYQMMLRKIPAEVNRTLRVHAQKEGLSLNRFVISLLQKALGLSRPGKKRDLSKLAGTWKKAQVDEFTKNTKIFERIDTEVWK